MLDCLKSETPSLPVNQRYVRFVAARIRLMDDKIPFLSDIPSHKMWCILFVHSWFSRNPILAQKPIDDACAFLNELIHVLLRRFMIISRYSTQGDIPALGEQGIEHDLG